MAFIEKNYESKGILFLVLLGISLVSATNIDCNEKSFHCINSTHFMICVDLGGGVSTTVDDFVIPCPPTTECKITNRFECEFQVSATPAPTLRTSDVTNELEISATTVPWEEIGITTIYALNNTSDLELSDLKNFNNESLTTLSDATYSVTTARPINTSESTTRNETVKVKNTLTTTTESHIVEAKVTQVSPKNNPRTNTVGYTLTTTTESHITEAKVTELLPHKKLNSISGKNDVSGIQTTGNAPPLYATDSIQSEVNVTEVIPKNNKTSTVTNIETIHESTIEMTIATKTTDNTLETTTESIYYETKDISEILHENTLNLTDTNNISVSVTNMEKNATDKTPIIAIESIYTESRVTEEPENKYNLTDKSNTSENKTISTNNEQKINTTNNTLTMEMIQTETNITQELLKKELNFTENNEHNSNDSITNNKSYLNKTGNTLSSTAETIHTEVKEAETLPEYKLNFTNTNATANVIHTEYKTNLTENNFKTDSINTYNNVTEVLPENNVNITVADNVSTSVTNNEQETKNTAYTQPLTTTQPINIEGVVTEIASETLNSKKFTNTNIKLAINEHGANIAEQVTPTMNSIHGKTNANEPENNLNLPNERDIITTYSPTTEKTQTESDGTEILLENMVIYTDNKNAYTVTAANKAPGTKITENVLMHPTESIYTEIMEVEISLQKKLNLLNFTNTKASTSVKTNENGTYISEHTEEPTMNSIHAETNATELLQENNPNVTSSSSFELATETVYIEPKGTNVSPEGKPYLYDASDNLSITKNEALRITTDNTLTPIIESIYTEDILTTSRGLPENKTNFTEINMNNEDKITKIDQTVTTTTIRAPESIKDLFTHENYAFTESPFTDKNTDDPLTDNKEIVTTVTTNKMIIYGKSNVPTTEKNVSDSEIYTVNSGVNQLNISKSETQESGPVTTAPSSFTELSKKIVNTTQSGVSSTIASLVDSLATTMDTTVTINKNTAPVSQTSKSSWPLNTLVTELTTQRDLPSLQNPVAEIQTPSDISPSTNEKTRTIIQDYYNNKLSDELSLTTMNSLHSTKVSTTNYKLFNNGENEKQQTAAVSSRPTEYDINSQYPPTDIFEGTSITNPEVLSGSGNTEKDKSTRNATGTSTTIFSNHKLDTTELEAKVTLLANSSNDSQFLTAGNGTTYEIDAINQSFFEENTLHGNRKDSISTDVRNNITTIAVGVTEKDFLGHILQTQTRPQNTANNNTNTSITNNSISMSDKNHENRVLLNPSPVAEPVEISNNLINNERNANTINDSQYSRATNNTTHVNQMIIPSFNKQNTSGSWQDSITPEATNNNTTMPVSVTEKYLIGHNLQIQETSQTATNKISDNNIKQIATPTENNDINIPSSISQYSSTPSGIDNITVITDHEVNHITNEIGQGNQSDNTNNSVITNSFFTPDKNHEDKMLLKSSPVAETDEISDNLTINERTSNTKKDLQYSPAINGSTHGIQEPNVSYNLENTPRNWQDSIITEVTNNTTHIPVSITENVTQTYNTNDSETTYSIFASDKQNLEENVVMKSTPFINTVGISNTLIHEENATRITTNVENINGPYIEMDSVGQSALNKDTTLDTNKSFSNNRSLTDNTSLSLTSQDNKTAHAASSSTLNIHDTQDYSNSSTLISHTVNAHNSTNNNLLRSTPNAKSNGMPAITERIPSNPFMNVLFNMSTLIKEISTPLATNVENSYIPRQFTPTETILPDVTSSPLDVLNTFTSYDRIEDHVQLTTASITETSYGSIPENVANKTTQNVDMFTNSIQSADNATVQPVNNTNPTEDFATSTNSFYGNISSFSPERVTQSESGKSSSDRNILSANHLEQNMSTLIDLTPTVNESLYDLKITNKPPAIENVSKSNSDSMYNSSQVVATSTITTPYTNNAALESLTNKLVEISKTPISNKENSVINSVPTSTIQNNVNINLVQNKNDTNEFATSATITGKNVIIPDISTSEKSLLNGVQDGLTKINTNKDVTSTNNIIPGNGHVTVTESTFDSVKMGISADDMHHLVEINRGIDINTEKVSNSTVALFELETPLEIVGTTESTKNLINKIKPSGSNVTTIKEHSVYATAGFTDTTKSYVSGVITLPETDETIDQVKSSTRITVTPILTLANKFTEEQTSTTSIYNNSVLNSVGNIEKNTESLQNNLKVNNYVTKFDDAKLNEDSKQVITPKNIDTIEKIETTIQTENISTNVNNQIASKQTLASTPVSESSSLKHTTKVDNVHFNEKETAVPTSNFDCQNRARGRYGDHHDCRKFYTCIGRPQPIVSLCPDNTVFSEIRTQCTKNMSQCIRENQFQCPAEGRFTDYLTNNIYYICVKNRLHFTRFKFQCQKGYHLDKNFVKCLKDIETSTQALPLKDDKPVSNEFICKEEGKFPNPDIGTNIYYMCVKNGQNKFVRFKFQCQKGYHLNKTSVRCLQDIIEPMYQSVSSKDSVSKDESVTTKKQFKCAEAGKFADPDDCRKYYMCSLNKRKSELHRKKKKCDSDEVFNKDKKKCVDTDSYEC